MMKDDPKIKMPQKVMPTSEMKNPLKQAGAELGQAQSKLGLNCN